MLKLTLFIFFSFFFSWIYPFFTNDLDAHSIYGKPIGVQEFIFITNTEGHQSKELVVETLKTFDQNSMISYEFYRNIDKVSKKALLSQNFYFHKYNSEKDLEKSLKIMGDELSVKSQIYNYHYSDFGELLRINVTDINGIKIEQTNYLYEDGLMKEREIWKMPNSFKEISIYDYFKNLQIKSIKNGYLQENGEINFLFLNTYQYSNKEAHMIYNRKETYYKIDHGQQQKIHFIREVLEEKNGKLIKSLINEKDTIVNVYEMELDPKKNISSIEIYNQEKLTGTKDLFYFYKKDKKQMSTLLKQNAKLKIIGPSNPKEAKKWAKEKTSFF